jgi:hypothetical protein
LFLGKKFVLAPPPPGKNLRTPMATCGECRQGWTTLL